MGAFAEEVELPLPAELKHGRPNLMPEAERHWAYLPLAPGTVSYTHLTLPTNREV